MNNAEMFLERIRVSWFGKAVGKAADAAAALVGQTLMIWLRLALYVGLAYVAGVALGEPIKIIGIVAGVALVAELLIGLVRSFWNPRQIGAGLYVAIWWPIRRMVGPRCPVCEQDALSMESVQAARDHIATCGRD